MSAASVLNKREELVAALAEMDATREYLEAALAEAETALVTTVTDASKIDADRAEAMAKVDKARARCRQLRAAIVESDRSESIARTREATEPAIKQSEQLAGTEAAAGQRWFWLRGSAASAENKRSDQESRRGKQVHRFGIGFSARERRLGNGVSWLPLVRQTIGFSGLALTYLVYYFIDVQLQILTLRSVFPSPFN
jgi:hypothetical protein